MNTIITGSTKGIGKSIADLLASKGHHLALCSRNIEDLEKQKASIKADHPGLKIFVMQVDVSNKKELESFAQAAINTLGTIDVLINNAGVFLPGAIAEEEDGALEKMINTNLYSAYNLTRSILPDMIKKRSGHIFNICSIASKIAYPNGGSYSISKFAMLGFGKVLREELKDKGIKVTNVLPGATWSNSWSGVDLPESRLMQANDIAVSIAAALEMSPSAVIEEIIIRPQLGDL